MVAGGELENEDSRWTRRNPVPGCTVRDDAARGRVISHLRILVLVATDNSGSFPHSCTLFGVCQSKHQGCASVCNTHSTAHTVYLLAVGR